MSMSNGLPCFKSYHVIAGPEPSDPLGYK